MRLSRSWFALLFLLVSATAFSQDYDVLIRNGRVVDGSGNPWFYSDVGIVRDRIVFVGKAAPAVTARRTIDAKGLIVAPGFIDMLGQSEDNMLVDKRAVSKLTQGITTEITGEGSSIAPTNDRARSGSMDFYNTFHVVPDWLSLDEYFERMIKQGMGVNLGTYVGAGQVRRMVIGNDNRPATPEELKAMQEIVEDAMSDGAMGVSSSLIYAPDNYATTEELIALAKAAAGHGGIYATHMRNEGAQESEALEETFRIGREANIPIEIFHLKVSGQENWGNMPKVIDAIEQARASGLDVTADQYPYIASATSLSAPIPPKFHAGGTNAFIARLKDPTQRAAIKAEIGQKIGGFENMFKGVGGAQGILVTSLLNPELQKKYQGNRLSEIATSENKEPLDALMDLVIADRDNVGAVYFSMSEDDVKYAMKQPWVSVGTDFGGVAPDGPLAQFGGHPRGYGSFPRILGRYVREEKLLRLEEAIRKFTSLAAQRVGLAQRGLIRPDYFADITIFNPDIVADVATFEKSAQISTGIEYVFVNGVLAVEHEKVTPETGGRPLRGPGYSMRAYAPEGLPPRGELHGVVTDGSGWAIPRARVTLLDSAGKTLATFQTKKDGKYAITWELPCDRCKLTAEREGFEAQQRSVNFNGTNPLWFGFALKRDQSGSNQSENGSVPKSEQN
jgi:dihydroorotase/N-acyl-D-amino-acid deacylase